MLTDLNRSQRFPDGYGGQRCHGFGEVSEIRVEDTFVKVQNKHGPASSSQVVLSCGWSSVEGDTAALRAPDWVRFL